MSSDDRRGQRTRRHAEQTTPGRVPPHDVAAEVALLGAAMLSTDALEVLVHRVTPQDFYTPGLGHVAAAAIDLFEQGSDRADPILLARKLTELGVLDGVAVTDRSGFVVTGPAALVTIQASTPATTNAAKYADLVHDLATLRRVIAAASEIAELGYQRGPLSLDVSETVIRAQALLADVATSATPGGMSTLDFGDLEALLAGTLPKIEPDFLSRTDGQPLFYAGRMHVLHGEPSSGKSWIALVAALEVLNIGGAVLYLDYEDSLAGIASRMLALGAQPDDLAARFVYVKQDGPFGPGEKLELGARLRTLNPDLVVIDGVAEALTRDGLSEDKATDVVGWIEKLPRWLARSGAAVVMLDHVAKDRENRGRWQRGSGAKLGAVDGAAYEVIVRRSFSRKREGEVDLKIAKDRPGGVGELGAVAASVTITPHADGERVVVELGPPREPTSVADPWKPTILMKRVSDELERAVTPLTGKAIVNLIGGGNPKLVREAIARLEAEGWVRTYRAGSTALLRLVQPYTEGDKPPPPADAPPTLLDDMDAEPEQPLGDDPDDPTVVHGPWQRHTANEEPDPPPPPVHHPDTRRSHDDHE
jgi:hypothetical protein